MDKPLFSVVIPTYNRSYVVLRSIQSVLDQTYDNIEILVIDDGSDDNTVEYINDNVSDKRVKVYAKNHEGAQQARNYGLSKAIGEYIIFLDSDDELLPTCLEEMISEYDKDSEVIATYVQTGFRQHDGSLMAARNDYLEGYVFKEVLQQGYLTSTSFISMRRSVFDEIGGWDTDLPASQDDDMCFRLAKHGKIKLIDKILGIYGIDSGNQIGGSKERVARGWMLLWNKHEKDVLSVCGNDTFKNHLSECAKRFEDIGFTEEYDQIIQRISKL